MRRAYQTGWVGEACLGSQTVICPGFHLTDWLQSQWVPLMAFCWGREGGGSTPPPSESLLSWGPTLSFRVLHLLLSEDFFLGVSSSLDLRPALC